MPELVWMPKKETYFVSCGSLSFGESVFKISDTFYLCVKDAKATRAAALDLSDFSINYIDFDTRVEVVGHLKSLVINKVGE